MTAHVNEDLETLRAFLSDPDIGMKDDGKDWDSVLFRSKTERKSLDAIRALLSQADLGDGWLTLTDRVLWRDDHGRWYAATSGAVSDPDAAKPLAGEFRLTNRSGISFRHIHGEVWSVTTVEEVDQGDAGAEPVLARCHISIATVRGLQIWHRDYWRLKDDEYQLAGSRFDGFAIEIKEG